MTICCALKSEGSVWIGSDTKVGNSYFISPVSFNKWRRANARIWWCAAGPARVYTLVDLKELSGEISVSTVLVVEKFAALMRKLVAEDYNEPDEKREAAGPKEYDHDFIMATKDRVVAMSSLGDCLDYGDNFCAIGSGRYLAYGAAMVAQRLNSPPEYTIRVALEAACKYDPGCGGDLFIQRVT